MREFIIEEIRYALKAANTGIVEKIESKEHLLTLLDATIKSNGQFVHPLYEIKLFLEKLGFIMPQYIESHKCYMDKIKNEIEIVEKKQFTVEQIQNALKKVNKASDICTKVKSKKELLCYFVDKKHEGASSSFYVHKDLCGFLYNLDFRIGSDLGRRVYADIIKNNIEIVEDKTSESDNVNQVKYQFSIEAIRSALESSFSEKSNEVRSKDDLMKYIRIKSTNFIDSFIPSKVRSFIEKLNPDILQFNEKNIADTYSLIKIIENRIFIKNSSKEYNMKNNYAFLIQKGMPAEFLNSSDYQFSSDNVFYYIKSPDGNKAVDVTNTDGIWLQFDKEEIDQLFIISGVDENNKCNYKILGYGKFVKKEDKYLFELYGEDIEIDFSSHNRAYYIVFSNKIHTKRYIAYFEAVCKELPTDDEHVLCIDFGTSNTAVGTWEDTDQIRLVKFDDFSEPDNLKHSNLLPTVVYIEYADLDKKEYDMLFGYDALQYLKECDYTPKGSFFLNIKQWLSAKEDLEIDCKDEDNHFFKLSSKYIISRYLQEVIRLSEIKLKKHYTKLHFSAPIKLKSRFNDLVNEIFNDKNGYSVVPTSKSLDEGLAIIYASISENRIKYENGEKSCQNGKITVIDCGGGTTDIANCEYKLKDADTGMKATISTKFENCFNFGGNDLTFLVFKLLKIKLSEYYKNGGENKSLKVSIDSLLKTDDFLEDIDKLIQEKKDINIYYSRLNEESSEAEWILPTDFGNSKYVTGSNHIMAAHRNFIYLWSLAEKVKIKFFSSNKMASLYFKHDEFMANDKSLYFYIDKDGVKSNSKLNLTNTDAAPDIVINNKELAALLSPQIYYTLSLVNPDDQNGTQIRLSGQSCRINLFTDLLKEFIKGKTLRNNPYKNSDSLDKKLYCVKGCVQYLMDKEYGTLSAKLVIEPPNIPFKITTTRGIKPITVFDGSTLKSNEGKQMLAQIPIIKRELSAGTFKCEVKKDSSVDSKCDYSVKLKYDVSKAEKIDKLADLTEKIKKTSLNNLEDYYCANNPNEKLLDRLERDLKDEEADSDGKLLIFAVPNNDGCGFILYQVALTENKERKSYFLTAEDKLYYEKAEEFKSIFDGKNCK